MREIKFRAWVEMEIFTGMIDVDVIRFDNKVISGLSKNNGHVGTILPNAKLMQYTGIKDKNGKEIYEGDIVAFTDDSLKLGVIKYKDCRFMINWEEDCFFSGEIPIFADRFDVLGNIYENPELLGV